MMHHARSSSSGGNGGGNDRSYKRPREPVDAFNNSDYEEGGKASNLLVSLYRAANTGNKADWYKKLFVGNDSPPLKSLDQREVVAKNFIDGILHAPQKIKNENYSRLARELLNLLERFALANMMPAAIAVLAKAMSQDALKWADEQE